MTQTAIPYLFLRGGVGAIRLLARGQVMVPASLWSPPA